MDDLSADRSEDDLDPIERKYVELERTNRELLVSINNVEREIHSCKRKYKLLRQRFETLNKALEKNACAFQQLLDDAKSSIQMISASIIGSPPGDSKLVKSRISCTPVRTLTLPTCLKVTNSVPATPNENENTPRSPLEAGHKSESIRVKKEAYVSLDRLSSVVIKSHLDKSENSVLNFSASPVNFRIGYTSTPTKAEVLNSLGLYPTVKETSGNPCSNFVSRRRRHVNENPPKTTPPRKVKKNNKSSSLETPQTSKRPSRKAKPTVLREESLKSKKRQA